MKKKTYSPTGKTQMVKKSMSARRIKIKLFSGSINLPSLASAESLKLKILDIRA